MLTSDRPVMNALFVLYFASALKEKNQTEEAINESERRNVCN